MLVDKLIVSINFRSLCQIYISGNFSIRISQITKRAAHVKLP